MKEWLDWGSAKNQPSAFSSAREIVSNPPNPVAKREALRLLAADATSAPLFEKVLRDKEETAENRQISASALHSLNPKRLQANAREMLLDKSEFDEIQATSLTAVFVKLHGSSLQLA